MQKHRSCSCKDILAFRVVDVTFSFKGFFVSLHIYIAAGDTVIHRWCNFSPILPPSSLSAMATYPPTCSNTNTSQGMNMANSIANLRLKAKEYSLNQVPTVNWNTERLGDPRGREEPSLLQDPPDPEKDIVSGMNIIPHTLDQEVFFSFWSSHDGILLSMYQCAKVQKRVMAGFSPSQVFFFSSASLNSCSHKKTSRLDAVAKYLHSFAFVIVT